MFMIERNIEEVFPDLKRKDIVCIQLNLLSFLCLGWVGHPVVCPVSDLNLLGIIHCRCIDHMTILTLFINVETDTDGLPLFPSGGSKFHG